MFLETFQSHKFISFQKSFYLPQVHFFVFKEVFPENSGLMYGFLSRAAYDGARMVCTEKNVGCVAKLDCIFEELGKLI